MTPACPSRRSSDLPKGHACRRCCPSLRWPDRVARLAESVDAGDLKSPGRKAVRVRVPERAPCGWRPSRRSHDVIGKVMRSEEHTSELQSLMRSSYAVFCLKKKIKTLEVRPQ